MTRRTSSSAFARLARPHRVSPPPAPTAATSAVAVPAGAVPPAPPAPAQKHAVRGAGRAVVPVAGYQWEGDDLVVELPVKTKNPANGSQTNRFARSGDAKRVRQTVARCLALCPRWEALPVTVTLTRHSRGKLDAHDGLPGALKNVVDEIALALPLPRKTLRGRTKSGTWERVHADDSDPRVTWAYQQASAPAGQSWVTVRFSPRVDGGEK